MRIPIREQLTLIILLASVICLAVASLATWITERNFVVSMRNARLSLTASLKAAQLASNLELMQTTVSFVASRVLVQAALAGYDTSGNSSGINWGLARNDLETAIGGDGSVGASLSLQAKIFPRDNAGSSGSSELLSATGSALYNITLPYKCPDGSPAILGDNACGGVAGEWGYPRSLYPNITYSAEAANSSIINAVYEGDILRADSTLLLGPLHVNETFSLVSLTVPVINNTSATDILGFLTVVMDARLIISVVRSPSGLTQTGQTLLVGPASSTNTDLSGALFNMSTSLDTKLHYIIPVNITDRARAHGHHTAEASGQTAFTVGQFPVLADAFAHRNEIANNAGSSLKTRNEAGQQVSVGFAIPQVSIVDWVIVVEMARSEILQPVRHLRNVLLACGFGTAGFMALLAFPLAHLFSLPIHRLRAAAARSVEPPGMQPRQSFDSFEGRDDADSTREIDLIFEKPVPRGVFGLRRRFITSVESTSDNQRKQVFRIPGRVRERKHWIKDELSDLTTTFNEMSDELMMQYTKLEERVKQRTIELELSKKAAEAANESKTLFIANISHELKTPLNGILGMCAVCMQEDEPLRLKRSLGIIYKSGDLLLNLLTDLLTFSKNQVGQQLSLDEKEFSLRDISTQVLAIFEQQAKEGRIDLQVKWENNENVDTKDTDVSRNAHGSKKLEDMTLWGDMHRILQVVINLVNNSLKFTPSGGSVTLVVRCLPEICQEPRSKSGSLRSRPSHHSKSTAVWTSNHGPHERLGTPRFTPSVDSIRQVPAGRVLSFEFDVEDTGPGIPEHLQDQIFEPFMQGDLGLSKRYGGTGLGLSICAQLAGLMKGTIKVESTIGLGSKFTMKIPLRIIEVITESSLASLALEGDYESFPAQKQDLVEPASQKRRRSLDDGANERQMSRLARTDSQPRLVGLSQPFFATSKRLDDKSSQPKAIEEITAAVTGNRRIRVLVAEDNKVNQEVVLRMLKLEDIYDVTVANDGQEALDFIKESMSVGSDRRPFDLIFMDVQMPRVDGLTSTRLIREIGYNAPIVALTAFSEESNVKDCMNAGMNYFLSKPIRRPQLKKVLNQYCAPIVEENEDSSMSDSTTPSSSSSTQVGPSLDGGTSTVVLLSDSKHVVETVDEAQSP